jgi:hypothetical protein
VTVAIRHRNGVHAAIERSLKERFHCDALVRSLSDRDIVQYHRQSDDSRDKTDTVLGI